MSNLKLYTLLSITLLCCPFFQLIAQIQWPPSPPVETPVNKWAIQLKPGESIKEVAESLNAKVIGPIGTLKGFYLLSSMNYNGFNADNINAEFRNNDAISWSAQQYTQNIKLYNLNDPKLGDQWHLNNTGQRGGTSGIDANVFPAWNLGYSGAGVQVCVIDEGMETGHSDLSPNYIPADSYDFIDDDANPNPETVFESHGTNVGGIIGAKGNNNIGVAGAAYDAKLSSIRLIGGATTAADFASALTFNQHNNHIYNNSWGPADDFYFVPINMLLKMALEDGVMNGRNGLGNIYVFSAGNGRYDPDNAFYYNGDTNNNPYCNSIYTINVGAYGDDGKFAHYSTPGASMLISAPSQGGEYIDFVLGTATLNAGMTTTDLENSYTDDFNGTSASAPLVSGIIALMLEANPMLTWRDVQHILVENATHIDPSHTDWVQNGAGKYVNNAYGFGGIDAEKVTKVAEDWMQVPPLVSDTSASISVNQTIPDGSGTSDGPFIFEGNGSAIYGSPINRTINVANDLVIERVELKVNITHGFPEDLRISLTSPSGTKSVLANAHFRRGSSLENYYFMTVRNWGENANGTWEISIEDGVTNSTGTWNDFQLIIHGTSNDACVAARSVNCPKILSDTYKSAGLLISEGTIPTGNTVAFEAKDEIILKEGFVALAGSSFTAKINDCTENALVAKSTERKALKQIASTIKKMADIHLEIYPNPVYYQTNLVLEVPKPEEINVYLLDALGKQVDVILENHSIPLGKTSIALPMNKYSLPNGVYFIYVKASNEQLVNKLMLIRG